MYAASACLVLVLVIMGVSMINSFDRMRSVQDTLDTLAGTTDEVETRETSGSVTAVTEEQTKDGQDSTGHSDTAASAETNQEENAAGAADTADDTETGADTADDTETRAETGAAQDSTSTDSTSPDENGSDGVYIVEEGDTLAIISKKMYGDVTHVDAICKMNGITDGNLIYVGQKLLLP